MTFGNPSVFLVRLRRFLASFLSSFFWVLASHELARAGDDTRPGAFYERHLAYEGVDTDSSSLIAIVRENDKRYLPQAIALLGFRKDERAVLVLIETLEFHEELYAREAAALALTRIGSQVGMEALKKFAQSSESWPRQLHLAAVLAEYGELSAFRFLAAASESDDPRKRLASMSGLAMSTPFDGSVFDGTEIDPVRRLIELGKDDDREIRFRFLAQIGIAYDRGANPELFRSVVEEMADCDPDDQIKGWAIRILKYGFLGPFASREESGDEGISKSENGEGCNDER
jgi:hypothetical protein